jgi:hypothetical protein
MWWLWTPARQLPVAVTAGGGMFYDGFIVALRLSVLQQQLALDECRRAAERCDKMVAEMLQEHDRQNYGLGAIDVEARFIDEVKMIENSPDRALTAVQPEIQMNDKEIEQEIQAAGKTAPRITPADIQASIRTAHYFTAADGVIGSWPPGHGERIALPSLDLLTFCVLVLQNGFTVTGESACASPENFDADIGRKIARQNAEQKIWPLLGYELRSKLDSQQ